MKFTGKNTIVISQRALCRALERWMNENRTNNFLTVQRVTQTPSGFRIDFEPETEVAARKQRR